jgi:uncharacterized protein YggT (Ycf19 family)
VTFSPRLLLSALLDVYTLAVIAYVVFRWLPEKHRRHRIYDFLEAICEPFLRPIRRVLPPLGGFDLTPLVAIILLEVVGHVVLRHVPG